MKQIHKSIGRLAGLIIAALLSTLAWAQEKTTDITVDINKEDNGAWYNQPWVWIIGAAVFILLLVALLRSGNRRA